MVRFDGWLLAADFDNTLRREGVGGPVPEANLSAAAEFMALGGRFTLATGRDPRSFQHIRPLLALNAPAVVSNGAVILEPDTLEPVHESFLPLEALEELGLFLRERPGLGAELHRGITVRIWAASPGVTEHLLDMNAPRIPFTPADGRRWNKAVLAVPGPLLGENREAIALAKAVMDRFPGRYDAVASGALVDIAAAGSDKGSGVLRLAELLGIERNHVICVGDSLNDLPMLRIAAKAFCPGDAAEAVRRLPGIRAVGSCERCLRDVVDLLKME